MVLANFFFIFTIIKMNDELTDSFWAGVVATKGSCGRQDLRVKSRHVPLLAAMQRRYGGYFLMEKSRGILRFRGDLRRLVEGRVCGDYAREHVDPIAWTRGVLTSSATFDNGTLKLPWIKKKGVYVQARITHALSQQFGGVPVPITEDSRGMLHITKPFGALVHAWLPVFSSDAQPNNTLSERVLLTDVNSTRYAAGTPQRMPRLSAGQKDAILYEAPRLTYKQIGARHNATVKQIKRLTQRHGLRKKAENVSDDTKATIANMMLQGIPPRTIRDQLENPCSTENIRRIGKEEWS